MGRGNEIKLVKNYTLLSFTIIKTEMRRPRGHPYIPGVLVIQFNIT